MDYFEYSTALGKSLLGELLAACKWEDWGARNDSKIKKARSLSEAGPHLGFGNVAIAVV
jgi:hypothetical protein